MAPISAATVCHNTSNDKLNTRATKNYYSEVSKYERCHADHLPPPPHTHTHVSKNVSQGFIPQVEPKFLSTHLSGLVEAYRPRSHIFRIFSKMGGEKFFDMQLLRFFERSKVFYRHIATGRVCSTQDLCVRAEAGGGTSFVSHKVFRSRGRRRTSTLRVLKTISVCDHRV